MSTAEFERAIINLLEDMDLRIIETVWVNELEIDILAHNPTPVIGGDYIVHGILVPEGDFVDSIRVIGLSDTVRAERIGLLTEVVAPTDLDATVNRLVHDHLQAAPGAVADTKALIAYVASHDLETNMIYTADRLADAWETEEGIEGINSFINKGVPSWRVK